MKIYDRFDIGDKERRTITIGNFDGLHTGHMKLIEKTIDIARKNSQKSSALTFKFHTNNINENKVKYLCTLRQKLDLFEKTGIDELFLIEFDNNIKTKKTQEFIKNILIDKLNVSNLVLGDDSKLGSDRLDICGIKNVCENSAIKLYTLSQVEIEGKRVTSSLIRNMITNGIVGKELVKFLGRDYYLEGEVIKGNSFGRKLGFPTANIDLSSNVVIPKYGVYYAVCELDGKKYHSGINIGNKPSVENNYFGVEAFLLDFNDNIYGRKIKIDLKKYMREEIKFETIKELKNQMEKDINQIRKHFIIKNI